MLLVKVRPSLPSARKVEQRGGATWPGCCCWPEWPGNFLSCLAFICSQHQHSRAQRPINREPSSGGQWQPRARSATTINHPGSKNWGKNHSFMSE